MAAAEALGDAGVLGSAPVLEFGGTAAVALRGGGAILHQRADSLRATAAGLPVLDDPEGTGQRWTQAVVHVGKGWAGTLADAAAAEEMLAVGGRLILCGDNQLGAAKAIARVGDLLGQAPTPLAQRAHGRIASFTRHEVARLRQHSATTVIRLAPAALASAFGGEVALHAQAGVFSGDALDEGTAALLAALAGHASEPRRVLDLGCGIGHLAIAALRLWPSATAHLADGDRRAIASATWNLRQLGLADRSVLHWWDAYEPAPAADVDLVLINPPFHTGVAVDFGPAKAMFRAAAAASATRSTWLIVANRRLPYEAELSRHGALRPLSEAAGFKVLEVRRG
ncbi:MAG TPA: methyltransferase [Planctomycetota bacterium]|nr:methyltransferase [Planctomycetota bacterium]